MKKHYIKDPLDYDTWFDYLRMVEQEGDSDIVRDTYERAISNIPDSSVKGTEISLSYYANLSSMVSLKSIY